MNISTENIKLLREKSGAGMVDCRNALSESSGDIDKAMEILRKKGIARSSKRVGRETAEGVIKVSVSADNKEGYIIEINSETDFVARNQRFQHFADQVMVLISNKKPVSLEVLLGLPMGDGTVKENLDHLSGVIGEKLAIKRFEVLRSKGTIACYSHLGGRIGVLAAIDLPGNNEMAYEMAMQVAAANPLYIDPKDVPQAEIDKEKEIYREQLNKEGKPENIIGKILDGKINKYFEEICLVKQEYIKDDKIKVTDVLKGVKVEKFIKYSL